MVDRVAITITDGSQSRALVEVLNQEGFRTTVINAVGGFLHDSLVTLLVGLSHERLPHFFTLVRTYCPRRTRYVPMGAELTLAPGYPLMIEAAMGGASVFILPVEDFRQL